MEPQFIIWSGSDDNDKQRRKKPTSSGKILRAILGSLKISENEFRYNQNQGGHILGGIKYYNEIKPVGRRRGRLSLIWLQGVIESFSREVRISNQEEIAKNRKVQSKLIRRIA